MFYIHLWPIYWLPHSTLHLRHFSWMCHVSPVGKERNRYCSKCLTVLSAQEAPVPFYARRKFRRHLRCIVCFSCLKRSQAVSSTNSTYLQRNDVWNPISPSSHCLSLCPSMVTKINSITEHAVTDWTYIRVVLGSNVDRDTSYPGWGFSWFFSITLPTRRGSTSIGPVPLLSIHFPIHQSPYHSKLLTGL
jgi:hypothetical protein